MAKYSTYLLSLGSLAALIYYFWRMGWNSLEFVLFCVGIVILWGPLAILFYILLQEQIADRIVRLTFSTIASYTLTTLAFFGLSTLHLELLFYIGQVTLIGWIIVYTTRKKLWAQLVKRNWLQQLDWILIALIVASLMVNIPYKDFFEVEVSPETGVKNYTYRLFGDHMGHAGWAYELDRHTPNLQTPFRAGTPDRAYHHFSNVTTMLLGRFTNQSNLLRVHTVYHYTIIEILICLAFYSLVKTLTRSRWAGYLATSSVYLLIISWPPLLLQFINPQTIHPFPAVYFTLFPHVSSGLDVVALTSSQMYSGLVVMYGALLGVLLISIRAYNNQNLKTLLFITALVVAATMRFRVHVFLAILPCFLLIMVFLFWQKRQAIYLLAGGLSLTVSLFLFLEMRSSIYLPGTTSLYLGYNKLTQITAFPYNAWPFAFEIHQWLQSTIGNPQILNWVWQIISMPTFVSLNIIGIPLLVATGIYLSTKSARQEFVLFSALCVGAPIISTLGAIMITSDFDSYSVGGQLPHHTRWYLFPLMSVAIWLGYQYLQSRLHWPRSVWISHAAIIIIIIFAGRQLTLPSKFMSLITGPNLVMSEDEWLALTYLHDQTPKDSIIISNNGTSFNFSGLAGRADYAGDPYYSMKPLALQLDPKDDRQERIIELWGSRDGEHFCARLYPTPATHLVEYAKQLHPLLVDNAPCLEKIWESPNQEVSIFEIKHTIDPQTQYPPILVEERSDGFNIFLYQDQYFAIAQSLEEINPAQLDEATPNQYQQEGKLFTANYLQEVNQLVDTRTSIIDEVNTSSTHPSLGEPELLFDGVGENDQAWHSNQEEEYPQFIDIVFHQPVTLQGLGLQSQLGNPITRDRAPKNVMVIEGKNIENTDYNASLRFEFDQPGSWSFEYLPEPREMFQHYRIVVLDNHGQSDFLTIQEMRVQVLIEEDYQGFNLYWYGDRFYALAQGLDSTDLFQIVEGYTESEIETFCTQRGTCTVGHSLEEIKQHIDQSS